MDVFVHRSYNGDLFLKLAANIHFVGADILSCASRRATRPRS